MVVLLLLVFCTLSLFIVYYKKKKKETAATNVVSIPDYETVGDPTQLVPPQTQPPTDAITENEESEAVDSDGYELVSD